MLDPKMLEVLACPRCADRPGLREDGDFLVCDSCHAKYPVENGIPFLLAENAIFDSNGENS